MAAAAQRPKLIAVVGPTASGKSALAIKIAQEFSGEIIAADSRTVYKGMNIGTAKPTPEDQAKVKHWGLDLVEPGQRFTAYQFKRCAEDAISDIQARGKLPILVGGSGLYIDSVIFDFGFRDDADLQARRKLAELSTKQLQEIILAGGYLMPKNKQNKRHLIRTIETKGQHGTKNQKPSEDMLLIGLLPTDKVLGRRIDARAEVIFGAGVLSEARDLLDKYGRNALMATGGIVYKICLEIIDGKLSETEAVERFKKADWQYARRQKTWFKRNPHINWFNRSEAAHEAIKNQLLNT